MVLIVMNGVLSVLHVTLDEMETDIEIFKENNINAVRTSHYPNQIPWYGM